jgi:hypothetical protein
MKLIIIWIFIVFLLYYLDNKYFIKYKWCDYILEFKNKLQHDDAT